MGGRRALHARLALALGLLLLLLAPPLHAPPRALPEGGGHSGPARGQPRELSVGLELVGLPRGPALVAGDNETGMVAVASGSSVYCVPGPRRIPVGAPVTAEYRLSDAGGRGLVALVGPGGALLVNCTTGRAVSVEGPDGLRPVAAAPYSGGVAALETDSNGSAWIVFYSRSGEYRAYSLNGTLEGRAILRGSTSTSFIVLGASLDWGVLAAAYTPGGSVKEVRIPGAYIRSADPLYTGPPGVALGWAKGDSYGLTALAAGGPGFMAGNLSLSLPPDATGSNYTNGTYRLVTMAGGRVFIYSVLDPSGLRETWTQHMDLTMRVAGSMPGGVIFGDYFGYFGILGWAGVSGLVKEVAARFIEIGSPFRVVAYTLDGDGVLVQGGEGIFYTFHPMRDLIGRHDVPGATGSGDLVWIEERGLYRFTRNGLTIVDPTALAPLAAQPLCDGTVLLLYHDCCGRLGLARIDPETGETLYRKILEKSYPGGPASMALIGGELLVLAGGRLYTVDPETGGVLEERIAPQGWSLIASRTPGGLVLASLEDEANWSLTIQPLPRGLDLLGLASPDHRLLALTSRSASKTTVYRVGDGWNWSLVRGEALAWLPGPGGYRLLLATSNGTVLYDPETGGSLAPEGAPAITGGVAMWIKPSHSGWRVVAATTRGISTATADRASPLPGGQALLEADGSLLIWDPESNTTTPLPLGGGYTLIPGIIPTLRGPDEELYVLTGLPCPEGGPSAYPAGIRLEARVGLEPVQAEGGLRWAPAHLELAGARIGLAGPDGAPLANATLELRVLYSNGSTRSLTAATGPDGVARISASLSLDRATALLVTGPGVAETLLPPPVVGAGMMLTAGVEGIEALEENGTVRVRITGLRVNAGLNLDPAAPLSRWLESPPLTAETTVSLGPPRVSISAGGAQEAIRLSPVPLEGPGAAYSAGPLNLTLDTGQQPGEWSGRVVLQAGAEGRARILLEAVNSSIIIVVNATYRPGAIELEAPYQPGEATSTTGGQGAAPNTTTMPGGQEASTTTTSHEAGGASPSTTNTTGTGGAGTPQGPAQPTATSEGRGAASRAALAAGAAVAVLLALLLLAARGRG